LELELELELAWLTHLRLSRWLSLNSPYNRISFWFEQQSHAEKYRAC